MSLCGNCESNPATFECESCNPSALCGECEGDLHANAKMKSHVRKPIGGAAAPAPAATTVATPAATTTPAPAPATATTTTTTTATTTAASTPTPVAAPAAAPAPAASEKKEPPKPAAADENAVQPFTAEPDDKPAAKPVVASAPAKADDKPAAPTAAAAAPASDASTATPTTAATKPTPPPTIRTVGRTVTVKVKDKPTEPAAAPAPAPLKPASERRPSGSSGTASSTAAPTSTAATTAPTTTPTSAATTTPTPAAGTTAKDDTKAADSGSGSSKVAEARSKMEASLTKDMIGGVPHKRRPSKDDTTAATKTLAASDDAEGDIDIDDDHSDTDTKPAGAAAKKPAAPASESKDTSRPLAPLPSRPAAPLHKKPTARPSAASKSRFTGKFESTKDSGAKKPNPFASKSGDDMKPAASSAAAKPTAPAAAATTTTAASTPDAAANTKSDSASSADTKQSATSAATATPPAATATADAAQPPAAARRPSLTDKTAAAVVAAAQSEKPTPSTSTDASKPAATAVKPASRPSSRPGSRRPSGDAAAAKPKTDAAASDDGTAAALEAAAAARKQQNEKLLDDAKRAEAEDAAARLRARDKEEAAAAARKKATKKKPISGVMRTTDSDADDAASETESKSTTKPDTAATVPASSDAAGGSVVRRPSLSDSKRKPDESAKTDATAAPADDGGDRKSDAATATATAAVVDSGKPPLPPGAKKKVRGHHKKASISRASFMGGEITEAERRSFLEQFHRFDADKNGFLERSELIVCFKELKYNYSEDFFEYLLNMLFPNKLADADAAAAAAAAAAATASAAPASDGGDAKSDSKAVPVPAPAPPSKAAYAFTVAEYERFMHDFTRIDRQVWEMIDDQWRALTGVPAPDEWNDILHPLVVFNDAGEPDLTHVFDLVQREIEKIKKSERKQKAESGAGGDAESESGDRAAYDSEDEATIRAAEAAVAAKRKAKQLQQKVNEAKAAAAAAAGGSGGDSDPKSDVPADAAGTATSGGGKPPLAPAVRKVKSDSVVPRSTDPAEDAEALAAAQANWNRRPSSRSALRRPPAGSEEAKQQQIASEESEAEWNQADREEEEFIRNEYVRFVSAFDRNKDGKATKGEIVKTFKSMGFELTDSKLHDIFHDTNTGNELTFREFRKLWSSFADHYTAKGFGRAQMEALFLEFDESGDGVVTTAEFKHVVSVVCKDLSSGEIDQLCAVVDANGDGKIDLDEFLMLLPHPTSTPSGDGSKKADPSTTKAGHVLFSRLVRATLPSPFEHIKTLVNMPSNFATSELGPLAARAEHRISRTLRPVLDHTGLRYRNLSLRPGKPGLDTYPPQPVPFFRSTAITGTDESGALVVTTMAAQVKTGRVIVTPSVAAAQASNAGSAGAAAKPLMTAVPPHVSFVLELTECVGIALPKEMEARGRIVGRRVHVCLFDDKTPVSNVHTIRADWNPEEEDRWILNSADGSTSSAAGPGRHVFVVKTDRPQTTLCMELSVLLKKAPASSALDIKQPAAMSATALAGSISQFTVTAPASQSPTPVSAFESIDYSTVTEVSCGRIRYTLVLDELSALKKEAIVLPVKGIKEDEILARRTGFGKMVQLFKGRVTPSIKFTKFKIEAGIDSNAHRDAVSYLPFDVITPIHSTHVLKMYRELLKERILLPAQPLVSGAVSDMALSILNRVIDMPDALQSLSELWARKYNEMERKYKPELSSPEGAAAGCTAECRAFFRRWVTFAWSIVTSAGMARRHQYTAQSFGGGAAPAASAAVAAAAAATSSGGGSGAGGKRKLTDRAFPPLMIGVNDIWRTEKMRVAMGLTTTPALTVGGVINPTASTVDQPSTDPFRSLASDGIGQGAMPDLSNDWKYRERLPKTERMRLEVEFQRFPALMCYEPFDTSELMFDHAAVHEPVKWLQTNSIATLGSGGAGTASASAAHVQRG